MKPIDDIQDIDEESLREHRAEQTRLDAEEFDHDACGREW